MYELNDKIITEALVKKSFISNNGNAKKNKLLVLISEKKDKQNPLSSLSTFKAVS